MVTLPYKLKIDIVVAWFVLNITQIGLYTRLFNIYFFHSCFTFLIEDSTFNKQKSYFIIDEHKIHFFHQNTMNWT